MMTLKQKKYCWFLATAFLAIVFLATPREAKAVSCSDGIYSWECGVCQKCGTTKDSCENLPYNTVCSGCPAAPGCNAGGGEGYVGGGCTEISGHCGCSSDGRCARLDYSCRGDFQCINGAISTKPPEGVDYEVHTRACWPCNNDSKTCYLVLSPTPTPTPSCTNSAPAAPALSSPANNADLDALPPSLFWNAPSSWGKCCAGQSNHYLVYLDDNGDFSSPIIDGESTTAASYSLSGLVEAGKRYYWKIVAHNGCLSETSSVWSFCINKAPAAATGLSPNNQSISDNQNISLSWTNATDWGLNCTGNNNQYLVYYCEAGTAGCSSTSVPTTNQCLPVSPDIFTSSCIIPGPLKWGTTYYWKVVTSNGSPFIGEAYSSFIITYPSAWWQTKTGDVYGGAGIVSPLWRDISEDQRYFSLINPAFGPRSGLVASKDPSNNDFSSDSGITGRGENQATQSDFSVTGHQAIGADFTHLLNNYSYAQLSYLVDLAIKDDKQGSYNSGVKIISSDKINKADLFGADAGLYYYPPYGTGEMAISLDSPLSVNANEKFIIFVEDDLNINNNIIVASDGFLTIIASGNITIAPGVTKVQGVYFANGSLTVESVGDTNEQQFNGQGIFVAKQGVVLKRNFRDSRNAAQPTEIFTFDPAYLFTAPKVFREKPYLWQEVIP